MRYYLNDGSRTAPALRLYLNTDNLVDLPEHSVWPALSGEAALSRLAEDGFEGVQLGGDPNGPVTSSVSLPFTGLGRVSKPDEADTLFQKHSERGDQCITLHVGWGIEDDREAHLLVEAVLEASGKYRLPAFIETHRATITQDMWRTVQLVKAFPEMLFNIDFSHYYCGQEMVYGDFEGKLDFLQPVFDRSGYIHGRIASPGFMQVPIENINSRPRHAVGRADYLKHFKVIWTRAMKGFKSQAPQGSILVFSPELLTPFYYYARVEQQADGTMKEPGDRYAEALRYLKIAKECFETV